MADPYRENKSGIYSVMPENSHSQIDNLIAANDLQQLLKEMQAPKETNGIMEFLIGLFKGGKMGL